VERWGIPPRAHLDVALLLHLHDPERPERSQCLPRSPPETRRTPVGAPPETLVLPLRLQNDLRREVELDHVARIDARNPELAPCLRLRRGGGGVRTLGVRSRA